MHGLQGLIRHFPENHCLNDREVPPVKHRSRRNCLTWLRGAGWGITLVTLPGCFIPTLRPPLAGDPLPERYINLSAPARPPEGEDPTTADLPSLQDFYSDAVLRDLISQALAGNQELRILEEEIQIAANEVRARRGAIFPFLGLGVDGGFDRNSAYMPLGAAERELTYPIDRPFPDPVPRLRLGTFLTWQIDIWRELRNARDAAIARLAAAEERRNAFVNRLVAEVADHYYRLLALDNRIVVIDQTIAIQEESLKVAIARKDAGRDTELPVQRFQAEVRKNQSEKFNIRQEQVEIENRINVLLGRFAQPIERPNVNYPDLTLLTPGAGLPRQLLLNRPEIRQAERELAAAGLDVLVARARFFPRLDITAGLGWEAFNPRYLFDPGSFIASTAAGIVLPFINRSAIKADYLSANARQLQALYNYQRVILQAYAEVVTQLNAAENFNNSVSAKKLQLKALEAAVDSATKLYQAARAEYPEVLFTQRELLDAKIELIDLKRRQLSAVIEAYRALGGGPIMPRVITE